jgi:hypothetical protein
MSLNFEHTTLGQRVLFGARAAAAFNSGGALDGLNSLREALGAPAALKDYGFAEMDFPKPSS